MPASNNSNKIIYLEFMRIVACFLVIVNHTLTPIHRDRGPSATWFIGIIYFFICKIAVPLFLMIMGAILLGKQDTPKQTAKRLSKGAGILIVASAFYYVYYGLKKGEELSLLTFFKNVLKTQTTNAFWYLYLYMGLLCLLPILQKLVKAIEKRELEWILFLSVGVLGIVPLVQVFVPGVGVSGYFTGVLFSTYIGVMLSGYYIEKYVIIDSRKFWFSVCLFVGLITFQTAATYYLYQKDASKYLLLDNRNFITITSAAICFYIIVKYLFTRFQVGKRLEHGLCYFGGLTFGIYLLSDFVIDLTRPVHQALGKYVHVLIAMGLWELLIFTTCAMIAAGMKQIPGLKKWI